MRVKIGDRVAGAFMQTWVAGEFSDQKSKSALGGAIDGLLAEYVTLHEDGVVHVPEHLSNEEAAALPCAAVTAWHALIYRGKIEGWRHNFSAGDGRCIRLCPTVCLTRGGACNCNF